MWFINVNRNIDAVTAIEQICDLFSDDEKSLLAVTRGNTVIPVNQQLKALYRGKYCLYKGEDLQAIAADLIDKSKLDFEKLKQRQTLIEQLAKPENYYQLTEKEDKDKKDTGIKGTTDSSNEVASFSTTKTRAGQAEYSEEYDIIGTWDEEDNKELLNVDARDKKHILAKDWEFKDTEKGGWKETNIEIKQEDLPARPTGEEESVEEEPTPVPTFEQQEEAEDTTLYLNTLSVNKTGARTQTNTTGFANMGKRIASNSQSKGTVKQFTKARAILAQLNAQEPSIRSRILTRFGILFTQLPCQ